MAQYFENADLPSKIEEYKTKIYNTEFTFKTDNGVFSKDKLDYGTRFMLETIPIKEIHGDVLDLGCGYGVVSIILSRLTDANFDGVDVNKRALHLCEMNKNLNLAYNTNFFESDVYSNITKKYDYIITNPPIRAGKEVVYKMLGEAKNHLKKDGKLYFVIRKEQGAKSCIKYLENLYELEVLDKSKGFFIISCKSV
jgi:16S rRNA (guanine1207-N2)-methyltransferase